MLSICHNTKTFIRVVGGQDIRICKKCMKPCETWDTKIEPDPDVQIAKTTFSIYSLLALVVLIVVLYGIYLWSEYIWINNIK